MLPILLRDNAHFRDGETNEPESQRPLTALKKVLCSSPQEAGWAHAKQPDQT